MMKKIFIMISLCIASNANAIDWRELIECNKGLLEEKEFKILTAQLQSYKNNKVPKIADDVIRKIPIVECYEELIDIKKIKDIRISMLPDPKDLEMDPNHCTIFAGASYIRKTLLFRLQKMIDKLDLLANYFGYEPGKIFIKVCEGWRDIKVQEAFFNRKLREIHESNPSLSEDKLFAETSKWVSPVKGNVPAHCTGGAIDIRLWNEKTKKCIDMGKFGTMWGENTQAPTFSEDLTDAQKNNRLFLIIAALKSEIVNYPFEWWHYSCKDPYASYWQEENSDLRKAEYGIMKYHKSAL